MSEELEELGEHIAATIDPDLRGWNVAFGELNIEVHAARIVLRHPVLHTELDLRSPLPADLKRFLDELPPG